MKSKSIKNSVIKKNMAKYSLFILTPMLLGTPAVHAQYWMGTPTSQEWGDASNWSHSAIPTVNDSIVVNAGMDSEAIINGQDFSVQELKAGATIPEGSDHGVVRIVNGGSLTATNLVSLGHHEGTTGYLNVSGTGSTFTTALGETHIGLAGEGHVLIEDGARFNAVNNTVFTGKGGQAGTSSFVVTGNGTQANIGNLILSYVETGITSDHTTIFNVMDGAVVNADLLDLAYVGKGVVTIDQATVNASSVIAGFELNSENLTLITGESASLNIENGMEVGFRGRGLISIEEGAYLQTGKHASIAYHEDSTGSIVVNGYGSRWDVANNIYVGTNGKALIKVEDGAILNTDGATIAIGSKS